MPQSVKIISWNINGIRAVAEKGAFDWYRLNNDKIIIAI